MAADRDLLEPVGSRIEVTEELESALQAALVAQRMTSVDLRLDTHPRRRSSDLRDFVITFTFKDQHRAAEAAALVLARRLSRSMDERSKPCLFVAAVYRDSATAPQRRVALWIFPQDEAFRLNAMTIELLTDIFSRSSRLRKLALFEGRDIRSHFTNARVLTSKQAVIRGRTRLDQRFQDAQLSTATRLVQDVGPDASPRVGARTRVRRS